jgi:hypothetical protein
MMLWRNDIIRAELTGQPVRNQPVPPLETESKSQYPKLETFAWFTSI